jgi:hypothetical protein
MPIPQNAEEIVDRFRAAPNELHAFLVNASVSEAILGIAKDYDLDPETLKSLSQHIAFFTLGFMTANEIADSVTKFAPQGRLSDFRADVVKKIFMPFTEILHKHGLNFETIVVPTSPAAPSVAAPKPPAAPAPKVEKKTESLPVTVGQVTPPTPAKPSPEPVVISAAPQQPAPAPIIIQAPAAGVKQETSSTASPPLAKTPTTIPVAAQASIPAPPQPVSVPSPAPVTPVPAAAPKPSPVVSTAAPAAILSKPATAQLPTAAPKITIAGQQPGVPTAPIQEEIPQKTQPEITPKAIRYTPAPVIREVPKVISPTDGKKPQEPQQQIAPQQVPPQQSKPQSPVIDLSTFQITQNAPAPGSQDKAQPSTSSMSPGTLIAQPKAKGNLIDLKGFL